MNTDQAKLQLLKHRAEIYKYLDGTVDPPESEELFNEYVSFFDAVVNDPVIDVGTLVGVAVGPSFDGDGRLIVPADSFVVRFLEDGGDFFLRFYRVPIKEVPTEYGVARDSLACVGASFMDGRVWPVIPVFISSVCVEGRDRIAMKKMFYSMATNGEEPKVLKSLVRVLGYALKRSRNATTVDVPVIRRTPQQMLKEAHYG